MQCAPLAIDQNHQNANAQEGQAERKAECSQHGTTRVEVATVFGDDLQADQRHSEGSATNGDGVGEVDEQPECQYNNGDDSRVSKETSLPSTDVNRYSTTLPPRVKRLDAMTTSMPNAAALVTMPA